MLMGMRQENLFSKIPYDYYIMPKVYRAKIQFWFFVIQTAFLFLFIIAMLAGFVFQITASTTGNIIISLMGLAGSTILLLSLIHPITCRYIVSDKGIRLHAFMRKDLFVPYSEISELRALNTEEAHKIWLNLQKEELQYRMTYDISGYFRLWKKHNRLTHFCTVQPLQTEISKGNEMNVTHYKTTITGKYVLLRDVHGSSCLLTPKDIDGMLKEAGLYLSSKS